MEPGCLHRRAATARVGPGRRRSAIGETGRPPDDDRRRLRRTVPYRGLGAVRITSRRPVAQPLVAGRLGVAQW